MSQIVDFIIVAENAFKDVEETYRIVGSNVDVVNLMKDAHFEFHEVADDARRSYFVDCYLAQVNNGGFSQFVYNTEWGELMIRSVREGLAAMPAPGHRQLFEQSAAILDTFSEDQLEDYLEGEYFGENDARDILSRFDNSFYKLNEQEDLIGINAAWLRSRPNLKVLADEIIPDVVEQLASKLPDLEARIAATPVRDSRTREERLIDALCQTVGLQFQEVTGYDIDFKYKGRLTTAVHFQAGEATFYLVDVDEHAMVFNARTHDLVAEMDAPNDVYGL